MIQSIAEVLRLLALSGVAIGLTLLLLRTGTTLTTLRTRTTLATVTAIATITTLTTLRALTALATCRTLHIVGRLLNQHTVAELVLTSLRINLKELHLDMVTLLDTGLLDSLEALPRAGQPETGL